MSYRNLLRQRCAIWRMTQINSDGAPTYAYTKVKENVACFLDLTYRRPGLDPKWIPEAERPSDRSGVLFLGPSEPLRPGNRIEMTHGQPKGWFQVTASVDSVVAARTTRVHHLEMYVQEVQTAIAAGGS